MDAICFVVGLHSKELRGKQLKDLIYRSTKDIGDGQRRRRRGCAHSPSHREPASADSRSPAPRPRLAPFTQRSGARR